MTSVCDRVSAMNATRYSVREITSLTSDGDENDGIWHDSILLSDDLCDEAIVQRFLRAIGETPSYYTCYRLYEVGEMLEIQFGSQNIPVGYLVPEY